MPFQCRPEEEGADDGAVVGRSAPPGEVCDRWRLRPAAPEGREAGREEVARPPRVVRLRVGLRPRVGSAKVGTRKKGCWIGRRGRLFTVIPQVNGQEFTQILQGPWQWKTDYRCVCLL